MDKEEIFRYINISRSKSICIDRRLVNEYPGIVRNIIIRGEEELQIDFLDKHSLEMDEGEFTLYFYYKSFEELFASVEKYLGNSIRDWQNFTKSGWYPEIQETNLKKSWEILKSDFIRKTLYLPSGFKDFLIPSLYWRGLAIGKLSLNHTDEELRKYIMSTLNDFDEE